MSVNSDAHPLTATTSSLDMKEFTTLKRKRASYKAKITIYQSFINSLLPSVNKHESLHSVQILELKSRLETFYKLYNSFDETQSLIESIATVPEEQYTERETFERDYYGLVAVSEQLIRDSDKPVTSPSDNDLHASGGTNSFIKLPTIELPRFQGDYHNWLEYRDTFISLIHTNKSIDNIHKFHYLRASLSGSAALIIESLEMSSNNYDIAWNLICDRYNNKRQLTANHVQNLFSLKNIQRESAVALRLLLDSTNKNLRALSALGEPTNQWDTIIIHLVSSKLDSTSLRHWEEHKNMLNDDKPTLQDLYLFLRNRADLLETLESSKSRAKEEFQAFRANPKTFTNIHSAPTCPLCKAQHFLFSCEVFRNLPVDDRLNAVTQFGLCANCLHPGHDASVCRGGTCKYCNHKHNTLLHKEQTTPPAITFTSTQTSSVLLSTALVNVISCSGGKFVARALLDNGSTSCYITKDLCTKLNLQTESIQGSVTGINNKTSKLLQRTELTVQSLHNSYKTNVSCFVLNEISNSIPNTYIDLCHFNIPQHIKLADPEFNLPAPIDILLGAEVFWHLIGIGRIQFGKHQPTLQETELGWLVSGCVQNHKQTHRINSSCFFTNNDSDQLSRFWELDNISTDYKSSQEHKTCEEIFIKTTSRGTNGRFVVTMPLKAPPECLGNSFIQAKRRFLNLEQKFSKDPIYQQQYTQFINEYINLGHMTLNTTNDIQSPSYFLPHHGVVRESSTTTKLRVVFDASARTTTKRSLNDIQMTGPVVQDDLMSILLRFRQHKYIISADIEKMYRQIEIHNSQRPLQQIIWRFGPNEPLQTYTLNTVTYGTASAPYLATRCIKQVGVDCTDHNISQVITQDFYCDDLLSGSEEESLLLHIAKGVFTELSKAQFHLRKWQSNHTTILQTLDFNQSSHTLVNLGNNEPSKTLGIYWHTKHDTITFNIDSNILNTTKITKRSILSSIGQIFDPLGLISPCVVEAKLIMQKLWIEKLKWDDMVPLPLQTQWLGFANSLDNLNQLSIPRRAFCDSSQNTQLHIFCDASQYAYGSCIYIRTVDSEKKVHVQLIAAKSKVAPLKSLTIPRLELCAALTGVKLCGKVLQSLRNANFNMCHFWSDSMIVLAWLRSSPHRLTSFVSHRVTEIQEITQQYKWHYVPSKQNPSDLISRGVTANQLIDSTLWFTGPPFLRNDEISWPAQPGKLSESDLPETRPNTICLHNTSTQVDNDSFVHKFSNFKRLIRITAYIKRFIKNCKTKNTKQSNYLTALELDEARLHLITLSQQATFHEELESLTNKTNLPTRNRLCALHPFIDSQNILRVGGRLTNSDFGHDKKFPILLSANHHICKLIFDSYHLSLLHAGPQLLLSSIRETYWPLGGRSLARKTVRSCVKCKRFQGKQIIPIMGNLPKQRMHADYAFANVGTDYAGPIMINNRKGRGAKLVKSYICIFVCLAVKAVHLELVTDLTKESFLAALNRFISRRGKPINIYSDNGTNFVGASKVIGDFIKNNSNYIAMTAADQSITFNFIPAYAPHFGGLWESGVKSIKHHLRRVLGLANLTYEELYTLLVQIEGILNSRPLTPLSSDPSDLSVLTPFHFLIGRSLTVVPHPQVTDITTMRLTRHQRIEKLRQHYWKRFYMEYISELQKRTKWTKSNEALKDGALVLVKEEASPPVQWLLGRVIKLYPGSDEIARVADIKTKNGVMRRACNKLCLLPIS